jgi:NAD(P)-dependent dehydrogenase (short-subunit alcohol dehydrogenase family)
MDLNQKRHSVNISSIDGRVWTRCFGIYSSREFAVETISEALSQQLGPLGLRFTVVEPGLFCTGFLGGPLSVAERVLPGKAGTAGGVRTWRSATHGLQEGGPARGAAGIVKAVKAAS